MADKSCDIGRRVRRDVIKYGHDGRPTTSICGQKMFCSTTKEHPSGGKRSAAESFCYTNYGSMFGDFSIRNPLKLVISCLILLNLLKIINSSKAPDTEGDALRDLLLALNDSNKQINWDPNLVSPCFSWTYVYCRNGHVVSLSLNSLGFSGTLSPAITKLKFLVSLELKNNNLSGPLPDYLGNMVQLENLNLASNKFGGSIPITWGQLSNLKYLDVSSNNLTGRIPEKLFSVATFDFTATHLACGLSFHEPCVSSSPLPVSTSKSRLKVIAASASCGAFILLMLIAVLLHRYHQFHKEKNDIFVDVAGEDDRKISFGQLRRFSWRELQLATDNFSESNIIGQGGFGKVYKGILPDNTKVAVKRLADYYSPGGDAAFQREVQLISVAVHKNLLRLIGFCTTSSEKILVYPYMQNLSVAYRLRDLKPDLSRLEEEEDVLLLDHIKKLLRENRLDDIVDGNLKTYDHEEGKTIVQVALLCTQSSPEDRPTMAEVVKMLQGIDLAERWAKWEQLEDAMSQEFSLMSHQYIWAEDSSIDQEAIQLSRAR
ncbi:unnamed protein product [Dovyalis caffra]|uniref:Protein kinase domain-containing protein n=1 Tax=Dovyalis caffra TaxID=77055 RepID=A0AAV1R554_9ROSI|nr:unnamed protein product [Dovyalis caffra]